jgi:hypothetical protein
MALYIYFLLLIALSAIVFLIRFLVIRNQHIPDHLFTEALKNENNDQYEAAVANYEMALVEVKKVRFNKKLKAKIEEKIKVLRTVIDYQKGLGYPK